jgi:hypothetical protein
MVGVVLEYLLRPISLLLIYLAIEGAVRFVGGLITGEIIPSLIVSFYFKSSDLIRQMACSETSAEPAGGSTGIPAGDASGLPLPGEKPDGTEASPLG